MRSPASVIDNGFGAIVTRGQQFATEADAHAGSGCCRLYLLRVGADTGGWRVSIKFRLVPGRRQLRSGALVGALLLVIALHEAPPVAIVRRAASIPETGQGLEGFVNAANALISPALVAMAAIAPLGCLVGAGALMFGSRRGMVIIGASLGTLIFLGSVKGIVA